MPIRTINKGQSRKADNRVTFHNAANQPIQFYAGWEDRWVEMDPGDEIQVPEGLTRPANRKPRVKPSARIGGKLALYYVCPYLAKGPKPASAKPEPIKVDTTDEKGKDVLVPLEGGEQAKPEASEPETEKADNSVDQSEVAKLMADHDKDGLKAMAKDLGLDVRGNLSAQKLAERIVASMS